MRQLLKDLTHVVGSGSQVALDHFSKNIESDERDIDWTAKIQQSMVERMGEEFHWAIHSSDLPFFIVVEQLPRVGTEQCDSAFY